MRRRSKASERRDSSSEASRMRCPTKIKNAAGEQKRFGNSWTTNPCPILWLFCICINRSVEFRFERHSKLEEKHYTRKKRRTRARAVETASFGDCCPETLGLLVAAGEGSKSLELPLLPVRLQRAARVQLAWLEHRSCRVLTTLFLVGLAAGLSVREEKNGKKRVLGKERVDSIDQFARGLDRSM